MNKFISIIGAGPAGSALACFLKQQNIDCIVFDDEKSPDLVVGESLVSAIIPILKRLGIEESVAEISTLKHGAALRHGNGSRVDFRFQTFGKKYPAYSYNVPRPAFDQIIKQRAKELGVKFINHRAGITIQANHPSHEVRLDSNSLEAAGLNQENQPDFLVDATGRSRLFSRALKLQKTRGDRNDVSYFALYENFNHDPKVEGQVVLSVLKSGWAWQIPHQNSLSVGVVINKNTAKKFGSTSAERLENIIDDNSLLANEGKNRKRISAIKSYSNYQLLSEKGFGNGWALIGDAFGFVDPMLSPGLHVSLESAELLEKLVLRKSKPQTQDFEQYQSQFIEAHKAWDDLVDYFYDGRILSMGEIRSEIQNHTNPFYLPKLVEPHITRILSSLVSGVKIRSKFNHQVLFHSCKHVISDPSRIQENRILPDLNCATYKSKNKPHTPHQINETV